MNDSKLVRALIWVLSIAIPAVVAILLFNTGDTPFFNEESFLGGVDVSFLPHLIGALNSATAVLLILGLVFIKNKNVQWHKTMMSCAFMLGIIFLVAYVIYHASPISGTKFGDIDGDFVLSEAEKAKVGIWRTIYLIVLVSHILLAIVVVPFVLFAMYFALANKIELHKKVVKYTLPIWMYVSITGVVIYLMIRPYYMF